MEYGLLGETLGHSFSPEIHRALAGYDYRLLPTPAEEVATAAEGIMLRGVGFLETEKE